MLITRAFTSSWLKRTRPFDDGDDDDDVDAGDELAMLGDVDDGGDGDGNGETSAEGLGVVSGEGDDDGGDEAGGDDELGDKEATMRGGVRRAVPPTCERLMIRESNSPFANAFAFAPRQFFPLSTPNTSSCHQ